jgi:hypothetical protein
MRSTSVNERSLQPAAGEWVREILGSSRVLAFAAIVPLLMRLPMHRIAAVVEPRRAPDACSAARERVVITRVDRVLWAARGALKPTCLTRGLTRFYFLRRAGVPVALCFGVGEPDGRFAGHCWLVRDGEPFLERTDPRDTFTETVRIPR